MKMGNFQPILLGILSLIFTPEMFRGGVGVDRGRPRRSMAEQLPDPQKVYTMIFV